MKTPNSSQRKSLVDILPRKFYAKETLQVAQDLLGKHLVRVIGRTRMVCRIVEVEAYRGGDDPASHAYRGLTPRNAPMFGEPGHAYIYFTYGNHYCLNATSHDGRSPGAILIRAVEPLEGLRSMRIRRDHTNDADAFALTNGPGKLTQALGIDKALNETDLTRRGPLFITEGSQERLVIARSTRIGIREGRDFEWRFYVPGNRYVSRLRSTLVNSSKS
jgi:DNA-3-methyladenine glycosylase